MFSLRTALIAALAVAIAFGQWRWLSAAEARGYERRSAEVVADREAEQRRNWDIERRRDRNTLEVMNEATKREQLARAAAAGARIERDGLRDAIATLRRDLPDATPAACVERADTVAAVLDECSAALEDLAGKAGRHADDALKLHQAWPR